MIDWNRIINKPENATLATYEITDGVSKSEINVVKDNVNGILDNIPSDYTLNNDAVAEHQYYADSINRINNIDTDLINSIGPIVEGLENAVSILSE